MPSAMSSPKEPVETTSTSVAASREPSFMIEPLPKARSICPRAASKARCLSIESLSKRRNAVCMIPLPPLFHTVPGRATRGRTRLYMVCSQLQRRKSPIARNRCRDRKRVFVSKNEVQSPYRLHGGPQTDDRAGDKESAGRRDDPRERSRSGADRQAQAASGFKGPGA